MKNLKKVSILFLSILALAFTACDNEPLEGFDLNGQNPFANSLVGTWSLVEFDLSSTSVTQVNGMTIESTTSVTSTNPNYNVIFAPSTFNTNGSYGYTVNSTVNGQTNTQNLSVQNVSGSGNYTTNGSEITTADSFFALEFQGMDLSQLQGEQTIPYTISQNGQTLTFTQNTTQTNNTGGAMTTSTVVSTSVWNKVTTNNTTCADASDFATAAATAYNNDNTNVNLCNAYKSALQNQINICGDANGAIQAIIDGLGDCSNTQPMDVEISVTAGTLAIEFDMVEVVVVGTTLKVTGQTSAANNYMIYFEIEEGATGMEIINPEFILTLSTTDPNYFPNTAGVDDFTSTITENGTGTLVGTFGGIVSNASGGNLNLSQGVININY